MPMMVQVAREKGQVLEEGNNRCTVLSRKWAPTVQQPRPVGRHRQRCDAKRVVLEHR